MKYQTVFRWKALGSDSPQVGKPEDAQVGDLITFFLEGFHTRVISVVHKTHVVTQPLVNDLGRLIDASRKVYWVDMAVLTRAAPEPPVALSDPPAVPSSEPDPFPEPVPPVPPEKKALLDLWEPPSLEPDPKPLEKKSLLELWELLR